MLDILSIPVHPAASLFPMLSEAEMRELANDIKTNGLKTPLVVGDVDGITMLIDGRNRREACRIVGITPHYSIL